MTNHPVIVKCPRTHLFVAHMSADWLGVVVVFEWSRLGAGWLVSKIMD
jgi:hypothetical protein